MQFSFLSLLAIIASATALSSNLESYTFEKYVQEFGLKFPAEEIQERKALFQKELAEVIAHNAKKTSYKRGINRFSALSAEEKKSSFGELKYKKGSVGYPDYNEDWPEGFVVQPVSELPKEVDWRKKGVVSPVKDQGSCGSCWAFASTAVIESQVAIDTGKLFNLSPMQIAMCASNPDHCGGTGKCSGATAQIGYEYVIQEGLFQEFQYPYTSYYGVTSECSIPPGTPKIGITDHRKVPANDYVSLMNAIAKLGPLTVSVDATTFHSYESGILDNCNTENPDINHAVVLLGYGEENGKKYWIGRNSWSASWGEDGFMRIARYGEGEEPCGLDITPQHGNACDGDTEPVTACGMCGILYNPGYVLGGYVN